MFKSVNGIKKSFTTKMNDAQIYGAKPVGVPAIAGRGLLPNQSGLKNSLVCILAILLTIYGNVRAEENLAINGDFESEELNFEGIPKGWRMWGPQEHKNPENYQYDTTIARSGKASLRFHRPKNTTGYIITDPQAIKKEPKTDYTFSFWVYSNEISSGLASITSYTDVPGYTNSMGFNGTEFKATKTWTQVIISLKAGSLIEGINNFLMLVIKATAPHTQDETFWIDDVSITAAPSEEGNLTFDKEILEVKSQAINHRLSEGERFSFTVDVSKILRKVNHQTMGIAFHMLWDVYGTLGLYNREGKWVLSERNAKVIRDLNLGMTRFYDLDGDPWSLNESIDKAAEVANVLNIPQENVILELESRYSKEKLTPKQWAETVKYSLSQGYKFRLWEVGNEVYSGGFFTPKSYIEHLKEVSMAIKAIQPQCLIGMSVQKGGSIFWLYPLLKEAAGYYDFICPHYYGGLRGLMIDKVPLEEITLKANFDKIEEIMKNRAEIDFYNPTKKVQILDTEWGMHAYQSGFSRADFANLNGNICGTLHRAIRMIYYLREGIVEGANQWNMLVSKRTPGFGIIPKDDDMKFFILYYLNYYFGKFVGDEVIDVSGTCPYYKKDGTSSPIAPVLATKSKDGKTVFIIIANGTTEGNFICTINLKGLNGKAVNALKLFQDNIDAPALVNKEEDVIKIIPTKIKENGKIIEVEIDPHSVIFISVSE